VSENALISGTYRSELEAEMRGLLEPPASPWSPLYGILHYHMGWVDRDLAPESNYAGKQIRPRLLLLVCQALGGNWQAALPAAAGIEFLHNFSLIHDDIEDDSVSRRGRATVWHLWGVPQAINAGDLLLAHAYSAVSRLQQNGLPPNVVHATMGLLANASIALCQGQYLDLAFERAEEVSLELYQRMIGKKTAALLAAATEVGALLGGADPTQQERYRSFGHELGLGFQIMDDILGIWGSSEITGKPVCDDLRTRKRTLPVLHALEKERSTGKSTLRDIYGRPAIGDEEVRQILHLLDEAGSQAYARETISHHHSRARAILDATGIHNESQDALISILNSALDRQF
jgi:geranylgeranyl diphosphate synthase type I